MKHHPQTFESFMDLKYPGWREQIPAGREIGTLGPLYEAFIAGTWAVTDSQTLRQRYAAAALSGIMANPERWRDIQRRYDRGQMKYRDASVSNAKKAMDIAHAMVEEEELIRRHGLSLMGRLLAAEETAAEKEKLAFEMHGRAMRAERELERVKACLKWYADGNHFNLEGWETVSGEPQNWLCPTEATGTLPELGQKVKIDVEESWMVDDGGIARAVLYEGAVMVEDPKDGEICVRPIRAIEDSDPTKVVGGVVDGV